MSRKIENEKIINELDSLSETPERVPVQAGRGRAQFLLEAKRISEEPVSISLFQRLSSVFQGPRLQASTLTIAIILGFLFVSFSTSASAASQALPNQFLYPYKIWLENQRLALTVDPEKEVELHLIFAQERLAELEAMQAKNHLMDMDEILENYQHHLNSAEGILSEHQEYLDQEEMIYQLETQAPHPSPEIEDGSEDPEDEHEEPPEPESTEETDEEEEETESSGESEEADSSDEPIDTSEPEETDGDDDDTEDSEETDKPDETKDPDEEEEPDDNDD